MSPIALADTSCRTAPALKPAPSDPEARSCLLDLASVRPQAVSADGLAFTLSDGRVILDAAAGGAAVASIGMGNKEVIQAMTDQAGKFAYAYQSVLGNSPAEELAQWLVDRSDGAFERAAFLNSGSEAMEAVIKLCRQYWVERASLSARLSLPGSRVTMGTHSAVSNISARRDIYEPLFGDFIHHATSPNYKRGHLTGESEGAYSARLATELEAEIQELGPGKVIAFDSESVVGSALGVMPPPKGYFPAVESVIKKYGLLLAMDEVMSGSGRVGGLFAHQAVAEGVKPDIAALAKADTCPSPPFWSTRELRPSCAKRVMHIIERDGLLANVRERGFELRKALTTGLAGCRKVLDVRGAGLFIAVELDGAVEDKFLEVSDRCSDNGLLVLGVPG